METTAGANVLTLNWTFGINRDIVGGVHNLSDGNNRKVLFYSSSHTGVLYDWINGKQQLLQGHCNQISTTAVSSDKRWIATADKGSSPVLIVWDTLPTPLSSHQTSFSREHTAGHSGTGLSALPIKTLFDVHDGFGVVAAEFTGDSKYLVTLGNEPRQAIMVWDWTTESDKPLCNLIVEGEPQKCLRINPDNPNDLITNGDRTVNFFSWDKDGTINQIVPLLSSKDFKATPSAFTCSAFIPTTKQSVTATTDGDVVVWTNRSLNNLSIELTDGKRAAVKFMKLHNGAINVVTTVYKKYIVTGGEDGFVKIFDLQ
ncbi:Cilia- and flagella-associated protein 251, partial [Blyttiomyces sp. JEL0837]